MAPIEKQNKRPKNRKNKIQLIFNEEKRRNFLTGFHKRKLQRKAKAKEELEKQLKEERKRLKQEARERYIKLAGSHRALQTLDEILEEEYETENVSVKVVELSANDIAEQNNWIGPNRPVYESDPESNDEESDNEEQTVDGMDVKDNSKNNKKIAQSTETEFKTKKEIKKKLKKEATKKVQKSKAFNLKYKIDRQKMKKKSLREKKQRIKTQSKSKKRSGR